MQNHADFLLPLSLRLSQCGIISHLILYYKCDFVPVIQIFTIMILFNSLVIQHIIIHH